MAKHIAIVGAGDIGRDIARCAASNGIEVFLYDVNDTILRRSLEIIKEDLQKQVKSGSMASDDVKTVVNRIKSKTELKSISASDIVIETSHNDIRIKKDLFKKLEGICRLNTILAANTSTISINAISSACTLKHKIIGMHFLAPAASNPIVEIMQGDETSEATVKAIRDLALALHKRPIMVRDLHGLVADRLNSVYYNEAMCILDENIASAEELDRIIKLGAGFLDGPFNTMDYAGLDTELTLSEAIYTESGQNPRYRPHPIIRRLVASSLLGVKSEKGFFPHVRKFKV